jgi:hypothetical protein
MPFSVPADRLPKSLAAEQVDTDITCCSRLHHISRVDVFEMLRGLTEKYTVFAALGSMSLGNGRGLSWHLYMRQLAQSRIGISVRGFTRDMSSYWEIPATGALMLCDSDKDLHPHALVDGKHMVVYRNVGDLKEKLCYYLEHEDERAEIAERGRAHVLEHHTCEARAKWVLDCVKGVLT